MAELFKREGVNLSPAPPIEEQVENLKRNKFINKAKFKHQTNMLYLELKPLKREGYILGTFCIKICPNGMAKLKRKEGLITIPNDDNHRYSNYCITKTRNKDNGRLYYDKICFGDIASEFNTKIVQEHNYELATYMLINMLQTTNKGHTHWKDFKKGLRKVIKK